MFAVWVFTQLKVAILDAPNYCFSFRSWKLTTRLSGRACCLNVTCILSANAHPLLLLSPSLSLKASSCDFSQWNASSGCHSHQSLHTPTNRATAKGKVQHHFNTHSHCYSVAWHLVSQPRNSIMVPKKTSINSSSTIPSSADAPRHATTRSRTVYFSSK